MEGMSHNALHNPVIIDYVSRDGRVQERELLSATLDLPLIMPLDLAHLDGYSASVRRSQLVEVLASCARRSVARATRCGWHHSCNQLPPPRKCAAQLALSGALCAHQPRDAPGAAAPRAGRRRRSARSTRASQPSSSSTARSRPPPASSPRCAYRPMAASRAPALETLLSQACLLGLALAR